MNETLKKNNSITNARYDFTACQMDILFCVISKIYADDTSNDIYEIHFKEIEHLTNRVWQYLNFRQSAEDMENRIFEIKIGTEYIQFVLFKSITYITGQGRVDIIFTSKAIEYLKNSKNNFTSYELQSVLRMSSKYAKRIYQICSQWKRIGETTKIEINELKNILGLSTGDGNKEYVQISSFKKSVLDIAVRQINEYSNLEVSYIMAGELYRKKPLKTIVFKVKIKANFIVPFNI